MESSFKSVLYQSLRAPIVLTTRLPRVFCCSTVCFNPVLGPGGHTALGYSAASSRGGHLARWQDSVPKTHLGHFSNQCLGWVKTSTQGVLERNEATVRWLNYSKIGMLTSYVHRLCFNCFSAKGRRNFGKMWDSVKGEQVESEPTKQSNHMGRVFLALDDGSLGSHPCCLWPTYTHCTFILRFILEYTACLNYL